MSCPLSNVISKFWFLLHFNYQVLLHSGVPHTNMHLNAPGAADPGGVPVAGFAGMVRHDALRRGSPCRCGPVPL